MSRHALVTPTAPVAAVVVAILAHAVPAHAQSGGFGMDVDLSAEGERLAAVVTLEPNGRPADGWLRLEVDGILHRTERFDGLVEPKEVHLDAGPASPGVEVCAVFDGVGYSFDPTIGQHVPSARILERECTTHLPAGYRGPMVAAAPSDVRSPPAARGITPVRR